MSETEGELVTTVPAPALLLKAVRGSEIKNLEDLKARRDNLV